MLKLFTAQDLEPIGALLTEHPGRYQAIHLPAGGVITLTTDGWVSTKMQETLQGRKVIKSAPEARAA